MIEGIDSFEILWSAALSCGVAHFYAWRKSLAEDRKKQDDRIHDLETSIAVLQSRETADYDRLAGIETRLKALETCQSGMKADVAAIRALLEARPRSKRPVAGSK